MSTMNASWRYIAMVMLVSLGIEHTMPTAAMESCIGQYSAAALSPLSTPVVVSLDLSGSTSRVQTLPRHSLEGCRKPASRCKVHRTRY
jgi:hypothetical protein